MAREMKESSVSWIGNIPTSWEIHRMKSCIEDRTSGAWGDEPTGGDGDIICLRIADFDYSKLRFKDCSNGELTIRNYDKTTIERLKLRKGDILIEKSGGGEKTPVGRTVIFDKDYPALYANFMDRLRCSDFVTSQWMQYLLVVFYKNDYSRNYIKQTTGIQNIDLTSMLANEKVPIPSLLEQNRITSFLDTQCAHIYSVVEKTRAAVEEYKKLKQAVITQAVTKGIRPNRKMKDSGIEWVGYMPLEWDSINPKALFSVRKDKAQVGERQLTASQQHGVIYQDEYMELTGNKVVTVEKDFDILKHVEIGDFVISMRSFQGGLEYSSKSGSISSAYVMLIPNHKHVFSRFYRWLLKSSVYIKALQSTTNMVRDGQAMRFANFIKVRLISVPMEEQREIADYLDEKTAAIESLIQKKEQLISELEAYKKSLIYEYVTGKKEVTDNKTISISVEFQIALLMCNILKNSDIKGRIHLQKVTYASDTLLDLFPETQYYRYPHGPYDLNIERYESIMESQGWVTVDKSKGYVRYKKTKRFIEFESQYQDVFKNRDKEIRKICNLFNVKRTSKAEKMATVLASWNDFLIDGVNPTDDMIINDIVTNWTANKANIAEKTWREELRQLKEKQLVPKGYGKHTLKKEQDSYAH